MNEHYAASSDQANFDTYLLLHRQAWLFYSAAHTCSPTLKCTKICQVHHISMTVMKLASPLQTGQFHYKMVDAAYEQCDIKQTQVLRTSGSDRATVLQSC